MKIFKQEKREVQRKHGHVNYNEKVKDFFLYK